MNPSHRVLNGNISGLPHRPTQVPDFEEGVSSALDCTSQAPLQTKK